MADDLASSKYTGRDPVRSGELTMAEIEKGQADVTYSLVMQKAPAQVSRTKGPRYTPVSKRQDKPDPVLAICCVLFHNGIQPLAFKTADSDISSTEKTVQIGRVDQRMVSGTAFIGGPIDRQRHRLQVRVVFDVNRTDSAGTQNKAKHAR